MNDATESLRAVVEAARKHGADSVAARRAFNAHVAQLEEDKHRRDRLAWAIRLCLLDLELNDSPCLSVASMRAVQSVAALAREESPNDTPDARSQAT